MEIEVYKREDCVSIIISSTMKGGREGGGRGPT